MGSMLSGQAKQVAVLCSLAIAGKFSVFLVLIYDTSIIIADIPRGLWRGLKKVKSRTLTHNNTKHSM